MNPTTPSNTTPLDCFASAIKHIIDAATIDPRCASIVPKFAVAFSNIAKDPQAKECLSANIATAVNNDSSHTPATLLLESMRVLSICAPSFGNQVSDLIPLIISVMSFPSPPSGFASTGVNAETSAVSNSEKDGSTMLHPTGAEQPINSDDNWAVSDDRKLPAEHSCTTLQQRVSRKQDAPKTCNREVIPLDTNVSQEDTATIASRESFTQVNYSESSDSVISSVSKTSIAKSTNKRNSDSAQQSLPDRIPKRQRIPPSANSSYTSHSSKSMNVEEQGVYVGPFASVADARDGATSNVNSEEVTAARERAMTDVNPEGPDRNISLKELRIRESYWKDVISYKPDSRCIPMETYLVIAVSSSGPDDTPYVLKKFEDEVALMKDKHLKAFLSIKKIILIERPVGADSMYYCIPNLHKWMHGSLQRKTIQERYFKIATRHIYEIKTVQAGETYSDNDLGIHVRYQDCGPSLRKLLPFVAQVMEPNSSSARQVPCISWGWSTANPNEYKNNRSNMFGSITPFLSDCGLRRLHQCDKDMIIDLVCYVIGMFSPYGIHPTPFYHSDPTIRRIREEFAGKFLSAVGRASKRVDDKFFLAEGVAFIFNNFVPFHVDQMNDPTVGMNATLAINCQCLITKELSSIRSVKAAMSQFHINVGDPLSFSIVIYSRKVIGDFVKRQLKLKSILNSSSEETTNNLPDCWWLLKPLIAAFQRIDSEVNSNAIWDDPSLLDHFVDKAKQDLGSSQYQGAYIELVAGFDPMRYWSPVKYLFDALQARQIIQWNRIDAMGFICFASLETNGTVLLSGIIDDVLSSKDPGSTSFMADYKEYGLYAALIFAGYNENKSGDNEIGTRYGYSRKGRELYHGRGTCESTPIAGGTGLLSIADVNKQRVKSRCDDIVHDVLQYLEEILRETSEITTQRRRGTVDSVARKFLDKLRHAAGPGISLAYAHNFMQVSSIFGFLPYEMIGWTCIDDELSDAYNAINAFYRKAFGNKVQGDLSLADADKHFKAAVKYIGSNMNWNATAVIVKNTLSELYRETNETVDRKDILFLFPHRNRAANHLYRWKMDRSGEAILQVLLISRDNKFSRSTNIFHSVSGASGCTSSDVHAAFTGCGIYPEGVKHASKYRMSEEYIRFFEG